MKIGIIKGTVCVDTCTFSTLEQAKDFLAMGVWPSADSIAIVENGFGIGDIYANSTWKKSSTHSEQPLTKEELLAQENKLLKIQIQAQSERTDFLEDCIAEMATVVYAQ